MVSVFQDQICWRAANPCPLSSSSSSERQVSCQAWFRCERAGDYVIRWRCPTMEEESLNMTGTALLLCRNHSESWQLTQCPPPVVCSDSIYSTNPRLKNGPTSTEITIIVSLAALAFFALVLLVVSFYKYTAMKKRYRTQKKITARHQHRHFLLNDYRFPMSYHNLWGPSLQQSPYRGHKNPHTSKPHGSSQPDVYFSGPPETLRYFEHLLASPENSPANKNYTGKHSKQNRILCNEKRHKIDPSIATESFVYHNPTRVSNFREGNRGSEDWFYQNILVNNESDDRENSVEFYHIYKGNIGSLRAHKDNHDKRNRASSKLDYRHKSNSNIEFVRGGHVSSIPIPVFGIGDGLETNSNQECTDFDLQMVDDTGVRRFKRRQVESDSSCESKSQRTSNFVTKSLNSNFSNVVNADLQNKNNRNRQILSPGSSKNIQRSSHRTSPDVINSHNFTNRFVRVGKNIYRPVHTNSPSGSSLTLNSAKNNYLDVSYDSFLNEHIKELAQSGGASSSTFEADHNRIESTNHRPKNNRY